jgi:hypothetical protein
MKRGFKNLKDNTNLKIKIKCHVCHKKMNIDFKTILAHCLNCGECWHKRESYTIIK